ncbi:MAG: DUF4145 domain-containing protein [Thaumarchaeota archaeon]|nr:DUF4145 domain-containing protein [Nitrososphaerota archaeon]
MSKEDQIYNLIKSEIKEHGYNSANFKLALLKEGELWKVIMTKIILDISKPIEPVTLLKENNFALENISISIEEFNKFLDYLKTVYVGNIKFEGASVNITEEMLYKIGNYKLCFVGNFPSGELYYTSRQDAELHLGIDKPIYHADYAIHDSVTTKAYHKLELIGHKIPLRNVAEALNHYWGTHYEHYNMYTGSMIYLPIFDASIKHCKVKDNQLKLYLNIDTKLVGLDQLSIGMIVQSRNQTFRNSYKITSDAFELKLDLIPDDIQFYLIKNTKKIDAYYWQSPEKQKRISATIADISRERPTTVKLPPRKGGVSTTITEENKEQEVNLFEKNLIEKLPDHLQSLLNEAQLAFNAKLYRATCVLLRSVLEEAITLIVKQTGNEKELYNDKNFEMGLQKKIERLIALVPTYSQMRKDLEGIKWFGDKATHEAIMPIYKRDIVNNLEPPFRLFLAKLIEFRVKVE